MLNSKIISNGILRATLITVLSFCAVYLLWQIREVLAYIFIAFALSLIGKPIINFLVSKLKFPQNLAAFCTILIFILIIVGLIALTIPLIVSQAENLSLLNYNELQKNINSQVQQVFEYLSSKGFLRKDSFKNFSLLSSIDTKLISNYFSDFFSTLTSFALAIFSVFFITYFFLADKNLFNQMIISAVPDKDENRTEEMLQNLKNLLSRYFIGLLLQVFTMFVLYFIILICFGIENAFIIALVCGLFNLIPYLGPIMGATTIITLSMSSMFAAGDNLNTQIIPNLIWIFLFYVLAQVVDNIILQPFIYSKSVKSHPLEIFIIMLIFGILFGPIGVVFAVPGYTVIRVILGTFFSKYKIVQSITKNI